MWPLVVLGAGILGIALSEKKDPRDVQASPAAWPLNQCAPLFFQADLQTQTSITAIIARGTLYLPEQDGGAGGLTVLDEAVLEAADYAYERGYEDLGDCLTSQALREKVGDW